MNHREILTLAFRIIGLWALVHGISELPVAVAGLLYFFGLPGPMPGGYPPHLLLAVYLQPLLDCIAAAVFLLFAPQLAGFLSGEATAQQLREATDAEPDVWLRIGTQ